MFFRKLKNKRALKTILADLKQNLSDHRYQHSLNVIKAAEDLASHYGADVHKAHMAALLHDNAKFMKLADLKNCLKDEWDLYRLDDAFEPVLHAFAGARRAAECFGVSDEEILNAIRFHTTGRGAMTQLEQIVFIADYIEAGRKQFESLEEARKLAFENLNRCCMHILSQTVRYLEAKGCSIHPYTLEALTYYRTICSK